MPPEFRVIVYRGKFAVEWREGKHRYRESLRTSVRDDIGPAFAEFRRRYEARKRPKSVTVEYAWTGYRESLGERPAAVTMGYEWKSVGPFFGTMLAADLTEENCRTYITKRRKLGRSDGTIWTEIGHLRSSLKWAEKKGLIAKAPTMYRPERPPPRDKRLTRSDARVFLDACDLPHIRLFVTLAITTGARMGAILGLRWDRVSFERGLIVLQDLTLAISNKRRATVPMNKTAREALKEAQEGSTGDYVISWGGGRVASVKKGLRSAGVRCGLPWVTAHVFRHSAASWMAEDGVPMAEIAQFLGHADDRLTQRVYARFSPTYLGKAAESLEFN